MKKTYLAPQTSGLHLYMENVIATSTTCSNQKVDVEDAFSEGMNYEDEEW